jgi:hypothetical protein
VVLKVNESSSHQYIDYTQGKLGLQQSSPRRIVTITTSSFIRHIDGEWVIPKEVVSTLRKLAEVVDLCLVQHITKAEEQNVIIKSLTDAELLYKPTPNENTCSKIPAHKCLFHSTEV